MLRSKLASFPIGSGIIYDFHWYRLTARKGRIVRMAAYSRRSPVENIQERQAQKDAILRRVSKSLLSTPKCMRRFEDSLAKLARFGATWSRYHLLNFVLYIGFVYIDDRAVHPGSNTGCKRPISYLSSNDIDKEGLGGH